MYKKAALAFLLFSTNALANEVETLSSALLKSYQQNPVIGSARESLKKSEASLDSARSPFLPSLNLSGSYSAYGMSKSSYDTPSGTVKNKNTDDNHPLSVGANLSQDLFASFGNYYGYKSSKASYEAAVLELKNLEQNELINAANAYLEVIRAQASLEAQKTSEKNLSEQYSTSQAKYRLGALTQSDLYYAQSEYENAKSKRFLAESVLQEAIASYKNLMGISPARLEKPELSEYEKHMPQSLDAFLDAMHSNNYSIKKAALNRDSADYAAKSSASSFGPKISLSASARRSYDGMSETQMGGDYDNHVDSVDVGISASMPLYNATTFASRKSALASKRAASFDYIDAKNTAEKRATSDYERFYAAKLSRQSLSQAAKASEVSLNAARKEYALGRKSLSDVLVAEEKYLSAKVSEIEAEKNELSYLFTALSDIGMMSIDLFK